MNPISVLVAPFLSASTEKNGAITAKEIWVVKLMSDNEMAVSIWDFVHLLEFDFLASSPAWASWAGILLLF